MSFKACTIGVNGTIREAMMSLEKSGLEVVLVTDDQKMLLGIMTDGDIRRALLAGSSLESPLGNCINRDFIRVSPMAGRTQIVDLMQARGISQLPITNEMGQLVGLHTLREILGAVERDNWAVIMAGGRGERLRPITDSLPKPMIRVAGRPILERIILHLVGFGIRRIFVSVNYKARMVEDYFSDGKALGCEIQYLKENEPLGTGGALSLLPEKPPHAILVLNGDVLSQFDVAGMLSFHENGNYRATVAVHDYVHTVPYGVVETREDYITGLREKPAKIWLVNAGIYTLDPVLLDRVPRQTFFPLPSLVEECLEKGESVGAFRINGDWLDVGKHRDLKIALGETDEV